MHAFFCCLCLTKIICQSLINLFTFVLLIAMVLQNTTCFFVIFVQDCILQQNDCIFLHNNMQFDFFCGRCYEIGCALSYLDFYKILSRCFFVAVGVVAL